MELGLGQRAIARSCGLGLSAVHDYLQRAAKADISWPLAAGEAELETQLFGHPRPVGRQLQERPEPDWKAIQ